MPVSPYSFAVAYIGLGDKEQALTFLQRAVEEKAAGQSFIKVEPAFDGLRSDQRFGELLRRMDFPQ